MTTDEPIAAELFKAALGERIRKWREVLQFNNQGILAERSGLSIYRVRRIPQ